MYPFASIFIKTKVQHRPLGPLPSPPSPAQSALSLSTTATTAVATAPSQTDLECFSMWPSQPNNEDEPFSKQLFITKWLWDTDMRQ